MSEMLQSVRFAEIAVGDTFVKPDRSMYGLPLVYGTDKDGYTTLRVDVGKRFEVVAIGDGWMTARDEDGNEITQRSIPAHATALKVVERPAQYERVAS